MVRTCWRSLTHLQVLSGKQPWSEIYEDTSVVICLAQGRKPARPKSRPIDDQHWEFINICWSPIQEHRPSSRRIVSTIERFLYQHSPAQSICDLIASLSRQSHLRCARRVSALDSWEHNGMRNAGEDGDCHENAGIEEDSRAFLGLRGSIRASSTPCSLILWPGFGNLATKYQCPISFSRLRLPRRSVNLLSAVAFQIMGCGGETDPSDIAFFA